MDDRYGFPDTRALERQAEELAELIDRATELLRVLTPLRLRSGALQAAANELTAAGGVRPSAGQSIQAPSPTHAAPPRPPAEAGPARAQPTAPFIPGSQPAPRGRISSAIGDMRPDGGSPPQEPRRR